MFPYDFEIKEINDEFVLYCNEKAVCIAQGDIVVKHKSLALITFIRLSIKIC